MIPTQTFSSFPEFANSGTKVAPEDAKYAAGFIPADVLPAEWANYFFNGSTKGITALNAGVSSMENEINNVLDDRGLTPSADTQNQLLLALQSFKAEAILAAHPVGSLYWTSSSENPAVTFGGGTWKQITNQFILAAGSSHSSGEVGGSEIAILSITNVPAHTHSMSHTHGFTPSGTVASHTHGFTPSGTVSSHTHNIAHSHTGVVNNPESFGTTGKWSGSDAVWTSPGIGTNYHQFSITTTTQSTTTSGSAQTTFTGAWGATESSTPGFTGTAGTTGTSSITNTGSAGYGQSFSIMPPYVAKYCWERTA